MHIRSIVPLCLTACMLFAPNLVQGQTLNLIATPVTSTTATGTYHIELNEISAVQWSVNIYGERADQSTFSTKHNVDHINIQFAGDTISSNSGGVIPGANWGAAKSGDMAMFDGTVTNAVPVDAFGGNVFHGVVNLAQSFDQGRVLFTFTDGNSQEWAARADIVPETSSLLLLLTGLFAFGPMFLKQKANRINRLV